MTPRKTDGSAGDADYGRIGAGYAGFRRPEPAIAAQIDRALGDARTVLNVGAGAGSYEPLDRTVTAVEPSAAMRSQRPAHLVTALDATAEHLPFPDNAFDASMATFTVHQWADLARGLAEMRRVTRGPVVVLSCDPREVENFWLAHYCRDTLTTEARRYPALDAICSRIGSRTRIENVPIPRDCADGFNEAYYARPDLLLDPARRLACSAWSFVAPDTVQRFERALRSDLESGAWDRKYGHLRSQPFYQGSLRLMIGEN